MKAFIFAVLNTLCQTGLHCGGEEAQDVMCACLWQSLMKYN